MVSEKVIAVLLIIAIILSLISVIVTLSFSLIKLPTLDPGAKPVTRESQAATIGLVIATPPK